MLFDNKIVSHSQLIVRSQATLIVLVNCGPSLPVLEEDAGIHFLVRIEVTVKHILVFVIVLYGSHASRGDCSHISELIFGCRLPADIRA